MAVGSGKLVTVFGGSGFVGRYIVRALLKRGYRVRAAVRRPDLAGHLQPLGSVGQVQPVQANLRYRWSIERAIEGADRVVNCVGILSPWGRQTFDAVQSSGAKAIAEVARDAGHNGIVHLSAIGADTASMSDYARTKGEAEAAVKDLAPDSVILRPSVIFGQEDNFFNQFGAMARMSPVLPLIGGGDTKFQPVCVSDVAEAAARAVDRNVVPGTYELGGPDVATFRRLMEIVCEETGHNRLLLPVPFALASIKAAFLQLLPSPLLTMDQVELLKTDNVVSEDAIKAKRTFEGLGITPHTMAAVLPSYLYRYKTRGQYDRQTA